jgi:hypothetical protein
VRVEDDRCLICGGPCVRPPLESFVSKKLGEAMEQLLATAGLKGESE